MAKDNCYNTVSISIVVLVLSSRIAYSIIIRGPSNTTAVVNESTHFTCFTSTFDIDERSIIWFHYPVDGDGQRNYVFSDRTIRTQYKDRFDIDIDPSIGRFDLLVTRLEMKDAGRYECRDDVLEDQGASAELTVLDSHLICESDSDPNGIVGPTQCDQAIPADEVQLSCRVNFNGRNVPQMVWKKSGESSAASNTDCETNKYNRVTCSTKLSANLQLNGSLYTCESTEQKYSCSWGIDNVLYAFSDTSKWEYHTGEEVSCGPNASKQLPCSFEWYNESSTLISTDVMFKPNDPGLYRCQAQCAIRNSNCKFTAMVINVSTVHEPGSKLLLWLLLLTIPVFVGVIMAVLYKQKCRRNRRNRRPDYEDPEEKRPLKGPAEEEKTTSIALKDETDTTATATNREGPEDKTIEDNTTEKQHENTHENPNEATSENNLNEEINVEEPEEESKLEETSERETIERHRAFLEKYMDPDFGLLNALISNGTLTHEEMSEVKEKSNFYKKNTQLLKYILEKNQYSGLNEALQNSEQSHIVNYLKANGERKPEFGEDWPLTKREISILNTNQKSLIDLLQLNILLDLLHSGVVINKSQHQFVKSKLTSDAANEALLEILRRRSMRDYYKTITCLRQSDQNHIADVLTSGGVVAKIHAHLHGPMEEVTQAESDLAAEITRVLLDSTSEDSSRVLTLVQYNLIAARPGNSVVLYIWCETAEELKCLRDSVTRHRLEDPVERLFNRQLTPSQPVSVQSVTMSDEEFRHLEAYFTADTSELVEAVKMSSEVQAIYGLSVLHQELFISRRMLPYIEVYDSEVFDFKRRIKVDGMTNTGNIASCTDNNCLYASDWNYQGMATAILVIDPINGNLIKTWTVINGFGGLISVASDTNVILCIFREDTLLEYTADGELIRTILLDNLHGASHAVKLNRGLFVVGCGSQNRVCLISTKTTARNLGKIYEVEIIKEFHAEQVKIKSLKGSEYVSVGKDGSILVSDTFNDQTVLLSSDLDHPRILISEEHGLETSWRSCFDESTNRWFVTDNDRVMVFRVEGERVEREICHLTSH